MGQSERLLASSRTSIKYLADPKKDTFDCLYEEGEEGEPKMMTVLLHPHIMGHANRTKYLEE